MGAMKGLNNYDAFLLARSSEWRMRREKIEDRLGTGKVQPLDEKFFLLYTDLLQVIDKYSNVALNEWIQRGG